MSRTIPASKESAANLSSPADTKSAPAVAIRAIYHRFISADDEVTALRDVSLDVASGELVAIVGPSGCGKTTLLNLVAGLEDVQEGTVSVLGEFPRSGNTNIGYLFARDSLLPWRTAFENVCLGMRLRGVPLQEREERAHLLLEAVGLSSFEKSYRAQLSQGMRQRVALARTLALEPRILLMDEPFSALDAQTRLNVQEKFLALWERTHVTVLLITHDLSEAVSLADRVVILTKAPGRLKASFTIELPRPRRLHDLQGDPTFLEHYAAIWAELKSEFIE